MTFFPSCLSPPVKSNVMIKNRFGYIKQDDMRERERERERNMKKIFKLNNVSYHV